LTKRNLIKTIVLVCGIGVTVAAIWYANNYRAEVQSQAMPGKLVAAHTFLESNCSACHTPVQGVDETKCITCHTVNQELLQRQPTAFHAGVANCAACHIEHQGEAANLKIMDHEALARIGINMIREGDQIDEGSPHPLMPGGHRLVSSLEARLDCASCHGTKDRHFGLFGKNCASCHATSQWTIPSFQHPSPRSTDCAQCHQAPPSHYMEHFEMVDKMIAARDKAKEGKCCKDVQVNQCYICHQTTSWNDIKGVGFYKHH
jgi:hypothetical protein